MKVNIQKIVYRVIPFISALAIIVACCHFGIISAFAEVYNYEDYILRVSVDGDNDLCVVQFPPEFFRLSCSYYGPDDIFPLTGSPFTDSVSGEEMIQFTWTSSMYYMDFTLDIGGNANYLNVTNIPSGSIMEFRLRVNVKSPSFDSDYTESRAVNVTEKMQYFDSAYNRLANNSKTFNGLMNLNGATNCRLPIDKPNDAYCGIPSVTWNNVVFDADSVLGSITIESCNVVFTISSAFREAGITGEYGEVIYAITKELAKNQESAEDFYQYMETEMGVTKDQLDDIMAETVENSESLEHIKTQNATIIAGQDVIVDQQDQMIVQNQTQIDQNEQMIEQNNTIITGDEESRETVTWVEEFVQESMNKAKDTLDDLETEKVEIDPDDFALDSFVNGQDMNLYFSFAQGVFANDTFATMCVACVSLVIVSFVFFGKK